MDTKRTCILLFGLCVLSWGCSSSGLRTQYQEGQMMFGTPQRDPQPRLVLTAYPRIGYVGVTMTFHVSLENVPVSDNNSGCQFQEWNFGDGAVSREQSSCDNFEKATTEDSIVTNEFMTEHTYRDMGQYDVQFTLDNGRIRSNKVVVYVMSPDGGTGTMDITQ